MRPPPHPHPHTPPQLGVDCVREVRDNLLEIEADIIADKDIDIDDVKDALEDLELLGRLCSGAAGAARALGGLLGALGFALAAVLLL